jgi:hypothetical protein
MLEDTGGDVAYADVQRHNWRLAPGAEEEEVKPVAAWHNSLDMALAEFQHGLA